MKAIVSWVLGKVLGRINGLKTYLGIVGVVISWVLQQAIPFLDQTFPPLTHPLDVVQGILMKVSAVLVALGFAHKLDKATPSSDVGATTQGS